MRIRNRILVSSFVAVAAVMSGCLSEYEPFVVLLDRSYALRLIATQNDGFAAPDGILPAAGNGLYLADQGQSAILRWISGSGAEILYGAASGLRSPEDMACGADGAIYVTDDSAGGLWRFEPGGALTLIAGPDDGLRSTEGITAAPEGTLLVGDGESHTIFRVTPAGTVSVFLGPEHGVRKAEALAYDEDGTLYIADDDQGAVFALDAGGCLHTLLDPCDGIVAPESIACMGGNLFITDNETGKLFRYAVDDDSLHTVAIFHGNIRGLQGIAVSDTGSIFLTVHGRDPGASYLFELVPAARTARRPERAGGAPKTFPERLDR